MKPVTVPTSKITTLTINQYEKLSLNTFVHKSILLFRRVFSKKKSAFHYQKIIFLSCSEIDNLFNLLMTSKDINSKDKISQQKRWDIVLYYNALVEIGLIDEFKKEKVFLDYQLQKIENQETLKPFENWKKSNPPRWWTAYNKIKHKRSKHFDQANLQNTVQALIGLLVAIKIIFTIQPENTVNLFSGMMLIHAQGMPRFGVGYTGEKGEIVIDSGTF